MTTAEDLQTLAEATILKATRHAFYDADEQGAPTDAHKREMWDSAISAQADAWKAAGIEEAMLTGGASQGAKVSASSNKGASLTYDHSQADAATKKLLAGGLSPLAEAYLMKGDLLGNLPGVIR